MQNFQRKEAREEKGDKVLAWTAKPPQIKTAKKELEKKKKKKLNRAGKTSGMLELGNKERGKESILPCTGKNDRIGKNKSGKKHRPFD